MPAFVRGGCPNTGCRGCKGNRSKDEDLVAPTERDVCWKCDGCKGNKWFNSIKLSNSIMPDEDKKSNTVAKEDNDLSRELEKLKEENKELKIKFNELLNVASDGLNNANLDIRELPNGHYTLVKCEIRKFNL